MNILALNAGSATLKYKLLAMPSVGAPGEAEAVLAEGTAEHSGQDSLVTAAEEVIAACRTQGIDALGHRVVHGGSAFSQPTRVTPEFLQGLRALQGLDPLHNPTETALMEAGLRRLPDVPAVAVFDTAFHRTLPEVAWRYALPGGVADPLPLRRYGFHGISHRYVSERLLQCLGRDAAGTRLIVCHLGSGASLCAVRDGISVDTSMGLTPLEGLMMGTRSGDVDPGLVLYLLQVAGMTAQGVDDLLNHQSGLLGVSGLSSDVRPLETAAQGGDARAALALEMFAYRACKYIGAYAAALGGLDGVAFTGGIGEHSPALRSRICRTLAFLGVSLNMGRNAAATQDKPTCISADNAAVPVWVIPTDEERQIARETYGLLASAQKAAA